MKNRGSVLIVCLLIILVMLILGLGFLGKRAVQYKASYQSLALARARAVAEAGVADCLAKLEKDLEFPPPGALDQLVFSYSEPLNDLNDGQPVGYYRVTVDHTWSGEPYHVVKFSVSGTDGSPAHPNALYRIDAELRLEPTAPGATTFELVNWKESSSY